MSSPQIVRVDWPQYDAAIAGIVRFLVDRAFEPELLVGIARGGLIPLTSLSHRLNVRKIGVMLLDKTATDERFANDAVKPVRMDGAAFRWDGPTAPRTALLVDDITAYGDTMRAARLLLRERFGERTSVLAVSLCIRNPHGEAARGSALDPATMIDHYAIQIPTESWVVFPWE
jgi:hypoxanthine phosphoribosyltransferase